MMASASTLDIEKFRKVHALMTGGATEGERASAKGRCEAMAKKAGLTLNQAIKAAKEPKPQKFDASAAARAWAEQHEREQQAAQKPRNIFEEIFNSPEMKAQRAERMSKNAVKRASVLKEYGSVHAVFKMTPLEVALRTAITPFSQINEYDCEITGEKRFFTQYLDGEMASDFFRGTPRARDAIAKAIPMPKTIGEAFAEIKAWNKLRWDRGLFYESSAFGYTEESEVQIRQRLIEDYLKTEPARSWQDLEDRLAWQKYEIENEYLDPVERDDPFMDRVEADIAGLRKLYEFCPAQNGKAPEGTATAQPAQNGRRTNADKAADVKALLQSNPDLSDREISRRVGVSPQTVGNWRARLAQTEMFQPEQGSLK